MKSQYPSFTVIIVFILLIICGIPVAALLNFELNPNTRAAIISVRFSWPGAEPRVIEQEASSRLEALFAAVNGVKEIRSSSGNGNGTINITLDKHADPDAVRFEISSVIRQAWPGMPPEIRYPSLSLRAPGSENRRPLITYKLNAPGQPAMVMKYAEDFIKPVLSSVKGIGDIEISGASPPEWLIVYNENSLRSAGLSPEDIKNAVNPALRTVNLGTGPSSAYGERSGTDNTPAMSVSAGTAFINGKDLMKIPLAVKGDRIIYLYDVATLRHTDSSPSSFYRINGLNTINIVIYAAPDANNLALGRKIKEAAESIRSRLAPGYELILADDSTLYITDELRNIAERSLIAFIILIAFMLAITGSVRHAALILIMIPGNIAIAVIFYYLLHLEIHLYALAGVTVSLGLMTDNIIIMSDHLRTRGDRKVFLAVLAGTLATVSALVVVFFLKEQVKANLVDFAMVIIINQAVSMLTALFVIPALMDKLGIDKNHLAAGSSPVSRKSGLRKILVPGPRKIIRFTRLYSRVFIFIRRYRVAAAAVFILGFGLPVYMLPDRSENEKWPGKLYNSTLGSQLYREKIRPSLSKITGGALRLFTEKVFEGSYFRTPEETSLYVTATMPRGTTLQQANEIVAGMEEYLKRFSEVRMFQTTINARNASLNIYFTKEQQKTDFPYLLKSELISKAIDLGGADWSVYGFGDGFSNRIYESAGSYSISMLGYNYDRLMALAGKLRDSLTINPRIRQVYIVSERTYYKPDNAGLVAALNNERAILAGITPADIYGSLRGSSLSQPYFATLITSGGAEGITVRMQKEDEKDIWTQSRTPLYRDSLMYKFSDMAEITRELSSPVISRINQQYQVFLQFDYIGSSQFARKYIEGKVENFKPVVPVGYTVSFSEQGFYMWGSQDKKQYWLLLLIIIMIFFICAILFESLVQPFAVILTIPAGYIGIFLTFYLFRLNFDQGGFAAMVMLSGITVNAAIYILNDYNSLRQRYGSRNITNVKLYFRAFNYKIIPVLLTVVSTILGFVPFLIGEKQSFWFPLAAGTTGGLLFSIIGIIFYLPLFAGVGKRMKKPLN